MLRAVGIRCEVLPLEGEFALTLPLQEWLDTDDTLHEELLREKILHAVQAAYDQKSADIGPDMRKIEKQIMLQKQLLMR